MQNFSPLIITDIIVQCDAKDSLTTHRTLDLTSSLEVGPAINHAAGDAPLAHNSRSVLTIAFQLPFDSTLQDNVANMARQYVRSVISSVQRVAMAISPAGLTPSVGPKLSPGSPEALTLAHWICQSYRYVLLLGYDTWFFAWNLNTLEQKLIAVVMNYKAFMMCFNMDHSSICITSQFVFFQQVRYELVNNLVFLTVDGICFSSLFLSYHLRAELVQSDSLGGDSVLKQIWHHQDAILCCSLKVQLYSRR